MAESVFDRAEELLRRVVALVQDLQAENARLSSLVQQQSRDLEELKQESRLRSRLVERLQSDRREIRSRVEKIVAKIATSENQMRETTP